MSPAVTSFVIMAFVVAVIVFNYIPCFIAGGRRMSGLGALILVNTLFGWTLIGWLACLLWAALGRTEDEVAFYRAAATAAARHERIEPHM